MNGCITVKETALPSECLVYKLVNNHKLAGANCAAKRAYRARRYYRSFLRANMFAAYGTSLGDNL
jgi:hypothetical protein